MLGADGEVELDFGGLGERWSRGNLEPRHAHSGRADAHEQRFDGKVAALQRLDAGSDQIGAGKSGGDLGGLRHGMARRPVGAVLR